MIEVNYFARSLEVKDFISFLIRNKLDKVNLESEKIILGNFSLNDQQFRRILNYSLNSILSFVSYLEIDRNNKTKDALLAKYFRRHRLPKNFKSLIKKESAKPYHIDNYYSQHIIESEFQSYELLTKRTNEGTLSTVNLDAYFVLSKLKLACNALMSKRMSNQEIDISFLPQIITALKKITSLNELPLIKIYQLIYELLLNNKDEDYDKLKVFLSKHDRLFSHSELRDIYTYAINFCIKKMNAGISSFEQETFSLYKNSLETKALYVEGKLSPFTYKNIVSMGIKMQEYKWTKSFIETYLTDLPKANQESFYALNLSRLFFSQGAYDDCIETLHDAVIKDPLSSLACRVIEIKAFYELDELELLDALVHNLNQGFRRKSDLAYHKENYQNFGRLAKKLTKLNHHDKERVKKLKEEINSTSAIIEKKWLLEKLDSL